MTPGGGSGSEPSADALGFRPDPAEFAALAKEHTIVPVWCEVVADTLTPVTCFANVVGEGDGFLFESVEGGERWGRYSFVGRRPLATLTARGRRVEAAGRLGLGSSEDGILAAVEAMVARFRSPSLAGLPPLHGGLVGYLGYDVVREVEHLPNVPDDDLGHPDAALVVIGQFCAFDHWRQRIVLVDNVVMPEAPDGQVDPAAVTAAYEAACERLVELAADCARPGDGSDPRPMVAAPPPGLAKAEATRTVTSESYKASIGAAKEYIRAGDIFQVVLSQRFDLTLEADPYDVYRALRLLNPSPYMYFLRFPEVTVVGASPEPMVRLRDGTVISRPIAGSRPRGENEHHDRLLEGELAEDPKELAEHIMLVDLARNDVGRVVRFGTEKVDELLTIERYSHIMHITSQVSGELAEGKGPIDVLRATLPAGTLSGTPKVRAMEIIDELEPTKRGIYGGVVGYIDFSGNVDTAIAIRTMVVTPDGRASVQAGAGIVADSDPQSEDEESRAQSGRVAGGGHGGTGDERGGATPRAAGTMTTTTLDTETEALRTGAGAFRAGRDVLAVRGPDAEAYLQGQLSQDVAALAVGASADSLLLEPDGKLSALVRVTRTDGQGFVLDVDKGYGEAVAARLRRFLLRSKVELDPLDWRDLSLRGAGVSEAAAGLLTVLAERGVLALPFEWNGWTGVDLLGPADVVLGPDAAALPEGITACSAEAVEACRIVSGIPAMGTELTGKTIAAEAGLVARTVSFTKGCYTGQELVARLDSRGSNVPRRLVGIVGPTGADAPLTRGMTLHGGEAPPGDGAAEDKVVGTITSAARSVELGAWVALGYLHRTVEAPGPLRVRSGDGVGGSRPARAALLPLTGAPRSEPG